MFHDSKGTYFGVADGTEILGKTKAVKLLKQMQDEFSSQARNADFHMIYTNRRKVKFGLLLGAVSDDT